MPPDEYSNFTQPDAGDPNNGRPGAPAPGTSDDRTKRWNPTGGPYGTGAWEDVAGAVNRRTFDTKAWGGRGEDVDGNGNPIAGTSGADRDIDRFRNMQDPLHQGGPVIDQTRGNEARGIGMGALDLLRGTAEGSRPSAAEQLGTEQGAAAQNAQFGIAASVRGGAAARAGAARGAVANAGTIGQQTLASNEAARANEMAGARGAYFGAASGMRGNDLGVATEQGNLDYGQRAANDARDAFYASKENALKTGELNRGMTAAGANLDLSERRANQSEAAHQADTDRADAYMNTAQKITKGAAMGAAGGYQAPPKPKTGGGQSESDKADIENSDEKTKTNIRSVRARLKARVAGASDPLTDEEDGQPGDPLNGHIPSGYMGPKYGGPSKGILTGSDTGALGGFRREVGGNQEQGSKLVTDLEAARLMRQGEAMQANTEALRQAHGLSTTNTPGNESASRGEAEQTPPMSPRARIRANMASAAGERPEATWGSGEKVGGSDELQQAIRSSVEKDRAPPERKMNPENPYTNSLFGHAEKGYASGRSGELGGMFGEHLAGQGSIREENRTAPGTRDFYENNKNVDEAGNPTDPYSQDIMMSDVRAKQQAFEDGANWSLNGGDGDIPKYMPGTVSSQGGAKRGESPVRGKDSTSQATVDEYPSDPSKRSPEDRAKVSQLHQFVNANEGDAFDRANPPGQGPPAQPLNPREGTPDQGAPRTSVANDMRKRARAYPTSQSSGEPEGETPQAREARYIQKARVAGLIPETRNSLTKPKDLGEADSPGFSGKRKIPDAIKNILLTKHEAPGIAQDTERKLFGRPSRAEETHDVQNREIQANQNLTSNLENIRSKAELADLRDRLDAQGIPADPIIEKMRAGRLPDASTASDERTKSTYSDERSKSEPRFGGPMAAANRSMEPKMYEYKDGYAQEEGQRLGDVNVGPIAQKMKKDPVAGTVIVTNPEDGMLGIDKAKGLKLVMGGLSDLQRQVDELHGKEKGRKA